MVNHKVEGNKGSFLIEGEAGEVLAEMTYSRAGEDKIIIDHTEVSDALRGQGAGKKMVIAAVEKAREDGFKIIPLCPFAKSVFDKNVELKDVVA